jgi:hypothetical protein
VSSRGKVTFGQYRAMRSGGTSVPSDAWYVVDSQGFALGPTRCDTQPDALDRAAAVKAPAGAIGKRGLCFCDVQQLLGENM